jgi:tetratricopeptide (TPR) repeat protein
MVEESMKPGRMVLMLLVLAMAARCSRQPAEPAPAAPHTPEPHAAAAPARTTLLGNLGSFHRPIRTTSVEAQQFFDEGLTLLYGFNHEEAFRSFERAAALDPAAPMPHWGMSLALGTNINDTAPADRLKQAFAHLAEAQKRSASGSPVEQGLVNALAKRYVADPSGDQMERERAYSASMGELAKQFPDDLDVAALYAESLMNLRPWKLYTRDGVPEPGTETIVATLEGVLARNPTHPGANHYYIHAVEASRRPDRASGAAARLETLVPGAGHLVHMPAHIYMRTGEFARSARANALAAAVDERYIQKTGAQGLYPALYYTHNVQFESAAAMFAGSFAEARAAAQKTVSLADPFADQMVMAEPFVAQELIVLVRFGEWAPILQAKPPAPARVVQTALHHFARGAALAATGKTTEAGAALGSLRQTATKITPEMMLGPSNSAGDVVQVAIADLEGRIAEATGESARAIAAYRRAVEAEDALGYNEPPDWLLPERERLGVALLRAGRAAEAEAVFRADLDKHVGNPRSLYGLMRSLEAQRKPADEVRVQFAKAWAAADVTLDDALYPARR